MGVNRYATAAGRKYQSDLMRYLRDEHKLDAENLVLAGAEDEGDVLLRIGYDRIVLEAKRTSRLDISGWVDQALTERTNYAKHRSIEPDLVRYAVVHKRRNYGMGMSYVTLPLDEWLKQVLR